MVRGKQTPNKTNQRKDSSLNQTSGRVKKRRTVKMYINKKLFKISRKILNEIKRMQTSTETLIPKAPFSRLVREIIGNVIGDNNEIRFQALAMMALQEAAEVYLTQLMGDSNLCAANAKRVTLYPQDMRLVMELRSAYDNVHIL